MDKFNSQGPIIKFSPIHTDQTNRQTNKQTNEIVFWALLPQNEAVSGVAEAERQRSIDKTNQIKKKTSESSKRERERERDSQ